MTDSYGVLVDRLRAAARPDRPSPPELEPYLERVRREAFRVTDGDVERLRELGFSEDEIFEHTVAVAVDAGLVRLDAAVAALR